MYYCCGISDKGAVRENNEDAYLVNKIVLSKAHMALDLLSAVRPRKSTDFKAKLLAIHSKLRRYGITHGSSANMQTTLCALAVDENEKAYVINVGDSRMYRFRGGVIKQLSTDQSLVQMLFDQGKITGEEKKTHAQRNVIFPVLGNIADDPDPSVTEIEGGIKKGDIIIICSDGLSDYITTGEFEEILAMPMRLPKRLRRLIDAAMDNGSTDNITVVGVSVR